MKALIVISALALAGCATSPFKSTEVLVQKDYIVRTAPDALKTLPPLPPALANPKVATNNQIAVFINNTEEYVANLEAMIQTLVNFYEKPVTTSESGQMRVVTPNAPATPDASRVIRPQTAATPASAPTSRFTSPIERLRSQ